MGYNNLHPQITMTTTIVFVIMGIVLIAVPIICAILYINLSARKSYTKRPIANTTTKTTMTKSKDGRTVFTASTTKARPPMPATNKALPKVPPKARQPVKSASAKWNRLSRPFSQMPATIIQNFEAKRWSRVHTAVDPNLHKSFRADLEQGVSPVSPIGRGKSHSHRTSEGPVSPLSAAESYPAKQKSARPQPLSYALRPIPEGPHTYANVSVRRVDQRAGKPLSHKDRKARPQDIVVGGLSYTGNATIANARRPLGNWI